MEGLNKALLASEIIMERKAIDPVLFEVTELTSITDSFLIASGNSSRQVQAIGRHLQRAMREKGCRAYGVEGELEGQWILIDYGELVVHIFYQPIREFYDLEGLWSEAPRIGLVKKMRKNRNNTTGPVVFITACIFLVLLSCVSGISAMSIDEESKLGKEFLISVNKGLPLIDDAFVNEYLSDLGNYIGQYQDTKPFNLNFYIAKDNQLNAFAGPAGHIFIYSGLINAMDQVDELASVISHEIGHVSVRHLASQQDKYTKVAFGTLAGMLAGVLIGGDAGEALLV